ETFGNSRLNCLRYCARACSLCCCESNSPRLCFSPRSIASSSESWIVPGTSLSTAPLPMNTSVDGVWLSDSGVDCDSFGDDAGAAGTSEGIWASAAKAIKKRTKIGQTAFAFIIPFLLQYRNLDALHIDCRFTVCESGGCWRFHDLFALAWRLLLQDRIN